MTTSPDTPSSGLSRRRFMQAAAAVSSQLLLVKTSRADGINIEAYTSQSAYQPGQTLVIYARDPQGVGTKQTSQPIFIGRASWPDDVSMVTDSVNVGNQVVPADAYMNGCRWAPTYRLTIPKTWKSGLYYASIGTGSNQCNVPFIVRPTGPSSGAKILVQIPVTTEHAYNPYGGKSLYGYNSTDGVPATKVSFDRPFSDWYNSSFDPWQWGFVRWLAKHNIVADYCTSVELHAVPTLLAPYQLVLSAGHDEYWSIQMRNAIDAHLKRGGNVAMFTGNTCWWQARFESSSTGANRTLVCYKSADADPIGDPTLKTINWQDLTPPNPSNTTTGLNFLKAGAWASGDARQPAPYVVQVPNHWAFAGTGAVFHSSGVGEYVGYETDACDAITGADGRVYPTGLDGTPSTARILAQADCSNWAPGTGALGFAHMLVYSRGGSQGTLFAAATTDWAYGLLPELNGTTPTPITTVTLNVINKLKVPYSEPADVRQYRTTLANGAPCYYYTTASQGPAGAVLDGTAFQASVAAGSGMVPVYRYRSYYAGVAQPLYSYSVMSGVMPIAAAQSWVREAVAFYAYPLPGQGRVPVYEFYTRKSNGPFSLDTFSFQYSTSPTAPAGWFFSGSTFYVAAG